MMHVNDNINKTLVCENCITGEVENIIIRQGLVKDISNGQSKERLHFVGPGLIDLQVNGVNKIDFNLASLTEAAVHEATRFLLSQGVTTFFPTVITNSDEAILTILRTLHRACLSDPLTGECVGGIHLEGPFLSPADGAKGAHDEKYIKAPDWVLFQKFQEAAGGRIKIVTLAPEWDGTEAFIRKCTETGVVVSIGHSMADSNQVKNAVRWGAKMSTHLGNGIPLLLRRHPNLIWDQLGEDELYACLIADGIHLPDAFIRTVMKVKGNKTLLISDATCFAGMLPGEYDSHIGGTVILDKDKRVSLKGSGGLLAGAAKTLLENVETVTAHQLADLSQAWSMASENVAGLLSAIDGSFNVKNDLVIFNLENDVILIKVVVKNGKVVFEGNF